MGLHVRRPDEFRRYIGDLARRQGNYEEALARYKQAIKLNSADPSFYLAIARMYARIGKMRQVVSNLQLAQKYASDPGDKLRYAKKLEMLKNTSSQESQPR